MTALEHILLPAKEEAPKRMKLTSTFGQHAAVIRSPSRDDLPQRTQAFPNLYWLRSRLMHGEISIADLAQNEWDRLNVAQPLLRQVILRATALRQVANDTGPLSGRLAQAYQDADAHQSLFQLLRLREGSLDHDDGNSQHS